MHARTLTHESYTHSQPTFVDEDITLEIDLDQSEIFSKKDSPFLLHRKVNNEVVTNCLTTTMIPVLNFHSFQSQCSFPYLSLFEHTNNDFRFPAD